MTFKKISEQKISKDLTVIKFEHIETGAKHTHSKIEGSENAFSIAFDTPIQNAKGIPHILEHIVLEGSKKYPVDNMFYKLMNKNFETMINAGTYNTFTTYYFGSNVEQGFLNLADVYLDATLNPLIKEGTFLQEGFRYEINEDSNDLKFSGVVYNEMMAWVGKGASNLYKESKKALFGDHYFAGNAGGDPYEIADNKYEDIVNYHKNCYAPSNSHTFTTGSIDVKKIHEKLEEFFSKFEKTKPVDKPKVKFVTDKFSIHKTSHAGDETVSAIAMVKMGSLDKKEASVLNTLLDLIDVKFTDYFMQQKNGISMNGHYVEFFQNEAVVNFDFNLDSEDKIDILMQQINFAFQKICEEGVDSEVVRSYFENKYAKYDQEKKGGYAVKNNTLKTYLVMLGREDLAFETREDIEDLEKVFSDENVFARFINENFMNKDKYCLAYSVPDSNYIGNYMSKIKEKEELVTQSLSIDERKQLVNKFVEFNKNKVASNIELPSVSITDALVGETWRIKSPATIKKTVIDGATVKFNDCNDDDSYARVELKYNLNHLSEEELFFEFLQSAIINFSAYKGMTREETNVWKEEGISMISNTVELEKFNGKDILYVKSAARGYKNKMDVLIKKTSEIRTIQDLTVFEDVHPFFDLLKTEIETNSVEVLDKIVRIYTNSMNNSVIDYFSEVKFTQFLLEMINQIENGDRSMFDRFVKYYDSKNRIEAKVFDVVIDSEMKDYDNVMAVLKENVKFSEVNAMSKDVFSNTINYSFDKTKKIALVADTSSAFVSSTVNGTPLETDVEEITGMKIMASYVTEFALKTLRIKLGAYGTRVIIHNGAVTFFTYRIPVPFEALDYHKKVMNEVLVSEIDIDTFESSKREIVAELLKYKSKRETLRALEIAEHKGVLDINAKREKEIKAVLEFTPEKMNALISKYFCENTQYIDCVATNNAQLSGNTDGWNVINYPFEEKDE